MRLSIIGCPDRKRFRPYVKRAALFYGNELLSKKMRENIFLTILFNDDPSMDDLGYANIDFYNAHGKPREFMIELNGCVSAANMLKTLAHEMVHVKQFALCETNGNLTRWKGSRITEKDYWKEPWEVEAYGLEVGLFTKFAIKEKLWDVFEGVRNPTEPLVIEDIGWKNVVNLQQSA